MSFLAGPECSTAANPLSQFSKHVQDDRSLQRDRLVGRGPGAMQESMRSQGAVVGQDKMMEDFLQDSSQMPHLSAAPFNMEHMRRELDNYQTPYRSSTPNWAAEFDPGIEDSGRLEAAFQRSNSRGPAALDFSRYQHPPPYSAEPATSSISTPVNAYRPSVGVGYGMGMGMGMGMNGMGVGMMERPYGRQGFQMAVEVEGKGKARMVELDEGDWEAQFAALDSKETDLDDEANAAMEEEMYRFEQQLDDGQFSNDLDMGHMGEFDQWDNFDVPYTRTLRDPQLGNYLFEEENPFQELADPFAEGQRILNVNGNLSLAALAFEAAVQKNPQHVEAWQLLGSAQAQNEKESPAIRALEQALKLDPSNLAALMGLAVSYTNEGYDTTSYRTLERWVATKYPSLVPPGQNLSDAAEVGFTDRQMLLKKVQDLFIRAAQLSPSGAEMDPDVQVGLGVLFYGDEEYEKAVDCFAAALASTEDGVSNRRGEVHLLWNRLGATLANSGRSEEAIQAYERALEINPSFVRARYNLGVSCINIGVYEQAAQHLLGALSMHAVVEREGRERVREVVGGGPGGISEEGLERMVRQNESTNLYDTLRRVFVQMGRRDLADRVVSGLDVDSFRGEFDF